MVLAAPLTQCDHLGGRRAENYCYRGPASQAPSPTACYNSYHDAKQRAIIHSPDVTTVSLDREVSLV
eukprot:2506951-Rhodomonas_salina.2